MDCPNALKAGNKVPRIANLSSRRARRAPRAESCRSQATRGHRTRKRLGRQEHTTGTPLTVGPCRHVERSG
jgi:hypothetical protein